jgi:hypothetical protein
MNQSNINAVKEQLRLLIEAYQRPLRGKLATLAPLRDEIFALHKKGASSAEIAALLAQCQVTISKDAVARFLRVEAARERNRRRAADARDRRRTGYAVHAALPVIGTAVRKGKIMNLFKWLFSSRMGDWDERRRLILWNDSEPWTIGDSFEGVQVWGDTGSGKSSTSARVFAAAMLRAGYGGLVLTVKPEDAEQWQRNLEENARTQDAVFFQPDGTCFNFLDYELKHGARLGFGSKDATRILAELVSQAHRDAHSGDTFWQKSAQVLIGKTLDLITAAGATPSMLLANEIIQSGPMFLDQTKDSQWQAQSKCWQLLTRGKQRASGTHDFEQAHAYWTREFPLLPEKTRQSIVATFTASVAQHFCSGPMHAMFGGTSNVSPDDIADGKIVVVNLPVLDYGDAGRFASIVWKYCTQLALQRRANRERPVFIFSDESHYFVTDHDQLFQTTARSARCAVVYLTQNRSNYLAESPGDAGRNRVASMCACLKTQILHQCSHEETRRTFAESIGKHRFTRPTETRSYGKGAPTHFVTDQTVDDFWVSPDSATRLKTGGAANDYHVEALMTKAGKCFAGRKPALRVKFNQRDFERRMFSSHTTVAIEKPKQEK